VGLNLIPSVAYSGDTAFKNFMVFNFLSYNNNFLEPMSFNVARLDLSQNNIINGD
jgi:hypothetical protein